MECKTEGSFEFHMTPTSLRHPAQPYTANIPAVNMFAMRIKNASPHRLQLHRVRALWILLISLLAIGIIVMAAGNWTMAQNDYFGDDNEDGFIFLISAGARDESKDALVKHMVSIRTRSPAKYFGDNHYCGGTIITSKAVITSAHCVMDKSKVVYRPRLMLVVSGTPNRLKTAGTTQQFPVQSIHAHVDYILHSVHDIALIIIRGKFPQNSATEIVKRAKQTPPPGTSCTILGWGRVFFNGPLSSSVIHTDLSIYSDEDCKSKLPIWYKGLLCAGIEEFYNRDPCRGDSGGPLFCNGELVGVISWTVSCGNNYYPSLYADVTTHADWIAEQLSGSQSHFDWNVSLFVFMYLFLLFIINQ